MFFRIISKKGVLNGDGGGGDDRYHVVIADMAISYTAEMPDLVIPEPASIGPYGFLLACIYI